MPPSWPVPIYVPVPILYAAISVTAQVRYPRAVPLKRPPSMPTLLPSASPAVAAGSHHVPSEVPLCLAVWAGATPFLHTPYAST